VEQTADGHQERKPFPETAGPIITWPPSRLLRHASEEGNRDRPDRHGRTTASSPLRSWAARGVRRRKRSSGPRGATPIWLLPASTGSLTLRCEPTETSPLVVKTEATDFARSGGVGSEHARALCRRRGWMAPPALGRTWPAA